MKVLGNPYVNDLGNGFSKRTTDGKEVKIEPSLVAINDDNYQFGTGLDMINLFKRNVFVGWDAVHSGKKALPFIDDNRYSDNKYSEMFFGTIIKDFQTDVTIPLVVAGLPIQHFNKKHDEVKNLLTGREVIYLNGKEYMIDIKDTQIMPQPLGTHLYVKTKKLIDSNSKQNVLYIDGGHGTLDLTSVLGDQIEGWYGKNIGMRDPFAKITQYINEEYGEINLNDKEIANALKHGIEVSGRMVEIKHDKKIAKILDDHFEEVMSFITNHYPSFTKYTKVIWTGGMSQAYKDHIEHGNISNFLVIDEAQEANTLGFFWYGKSLMQIQKQGK